MLLCLYGKAVWSGVRLERLDCLRARTLTGVRFAVPGAARAAHASPACVAPVYERAVCGLYALPFPSLAPTHLLCLLLLPFGMVSFLLLRVTFFVDSLSRHSAACCGPDAACTRPTPACSLAAGGAFARARTDGRGAAGLSCSLRAELCEILTCIYYLYGRGAPSPVGILRWEDWVLGVTRRGSRSNDGWCGHELVVRKAWLNGRRQARGQTSLNNTIAIHSFSSGRHRLCSCALLPAAAPCSGRTRWRYSCVGGSKFRRRCIHVRRHENAVSGGYSGDNSGGRSGMLLLCYRTVLAAAN